MALLKILIAPDPILSTPTSPLKAMTPEVQEIIDNMADTMYEGDGGIGLAANQVGIPYRIFVMDVGQNNSLHGETDLIEKELLTFVNPQIIHFSKETTVFDESCLSLPDIQVPIERPISVIVRYMDRSGNAQERTFHGLQARCIQHEIDHLDGKVVVDYLSELKRSRWIKKSLKFFK
jgi:peptide deformylase